MRKSLYIGMVMCLLSGWTARAQRTVDLDFRQVTLNVVFDAIERQTGQPVYRQPLETDSMVVSVHSEKEEPWWRCGVRWRELPSKYPRMAAPSLC